MRQTDNSHVFEDTNEEINSDGRASQCRSDRRVSAGNRRQCRDQVVLMKSMKAQVIVSVLGSAATVVTLASVVGAGKKWS
jgi:hypothetical protein